MKKLHLPEIEFYITNVCNLTCKGCNRFNNYKFQGFQRWEDHEEIYSQWAKELDLSRMCIMGGEPLLNPTLYEWIAGLRKLWPQAPLMITSNGTQLHNHKDLYNILLEDRMINYEISLHNKMSKKMIIDKVENFLVGPFKHEFDGTEYREVLTIADSNNIKIKIRYNWWFHQGAIKTTETGYILHSSDREQAHKICHSKTCHHFDHGALYKCGPVAKFPEFDQQFNLELTPEDREIMLGYRPLQATDSMEVKQAFMDNINNSIPQCKFCPDEYHGEQIFAVEKKVFFKK